MPSQPKVSVITTVFNNRRFIRGAMESVLLQTYPNVEYIVKDAGSTDGTPGVVKEYAEYLTLIVEPDTSMYDGLNQALRFATGDIIAILNSDDLYATDHSIAHMVRTMEETGADVGWGDLVFVDRNNKKKVVRRWKSSPYGRDKFKRGWMPPHPTFFVRREVYEKYGAFRTDMGTAADYELMLRFLERFKVRSCYLPEVVVTMRTGGMSSSLSSRLWKHRIYESRAWKVNGLGNGLLPSWLQLFRKIPQLLV